MRYQQAAKHFSKAHSDDQGDGVWVLPQDTSRAGEDFQAFGAGTRTQVLRGVSSSPAFQLYSSVGLGSGLWEGPGWIQS